MDGFKWEAEQSDLVLLGLFSEKPNELCNKLRWVTQKKQVEKHSNSFDCENVAINYNEGEYKGIPSIERLKSSTILKKNKNNALFQ